MSKTQAGVHIVFFGAGVLFGCLFGDLAIPKHAFPQIDTAIRKTKNREIPKEIAVFCPFKMVGARRVELLTFCTPSKRATRLRYAPKGLKSLVVEVRRFELLTS